jgi:hypothetical protein
MGRCLALAALVFSAVALCLRNAAAAPRVAFVSSEPSDWHGHEDVAEQLGAELRAAGFEVLLVREPAPLSIGSLETVARRTGSFAAVAVVRVPGELTAADVWVADRVTGKSLLRRVRADGAREASSRILALRTVELLNASLIELDRADRPRTDTEPAPEVLDWVESRRVSGKEPRAGRILLAAGAGMLMGFGGIPLAAAPALEIGWRPVESWSGRLFLVGPAISTISSGPGSARLDQELALLRAVYEPRGIWGFDPLAALAAGVYRLGVQGDALFPFAGRPAQAVAAAFGGGLGLRFAFSGQLGVSLRGDALYIAPQPVVRFVGRAEAETANPLIVASLALEGSW